jgi:hypothetical protein
MTITIIITIISSKTSVRVKLCLINAPEILSLSSKVVYLITKPCYSIRSREGCENNTVILFSVSPLLFDVSWKEKINESVAGGMKAFHCFIEFTDYD